MLSTITSKSKVSAPFIARTLRRAAQDRVLINASSLAFHWFIALIPGAIASIGLANLIGLSPTRLQSLTHGITVLLPASAAKTFDQALNTRQSGSSNISAVIIGGLIALWASLEASSTLQTALDMAYETDTDRGFFQKRIRGIPLVGVTILFGGSAFALLVVGGPIGSLVRPKGSDVWFPIVWNTLRWLFGIASVFVLISFYDYLGPNRTQRQWKLLSFGGSISTVLWLIVATGYSFYLNHFGHSAQTYGAFSGVVALLLWLFLAGTVILIGAEFNRELERSRS